MVSIYKGIINITIIFFSKNTGVLHDLLRGAHSVILHLHGDVHAAVHQPARAAAAAGLRAHRHQPRPRLPPTARGCAQHAHLLQGHRLRQLQVLGEPAH